MKINLIYQSNLNFKAEAREFKHIIVDEPESFHGNDLGPSPIEYLLIGIGGCLGSTLTYCFQKRGVALEKLDVEVDGKIKHVPPRMNLRLIEITLNFSYSLKRESTREKADECFKKFKRFCPIYEPLAKGIPIHINYIEKKS